MNPSKRGRSPKNGATPGARSSTGMSRWPFHAAVLGLMLLAPFAPWPQGRSSVRAEPVVTADMSVWQAVDLQGGVVNPTAQPESDQEKAVMLRALQGPDPLVGVQPAPTSGLAPSVGPTGTPSPVLTASPPAGPNADSGTDLGARSSDIPGSARRYSFQHRPAVRREPGNRPVGERHG